MSLADAFAEGSQRNGPKCSISTLRKNLSEIDRAEFDAACEDGTPFAVIARVMRARGFAVTGNTVQRHARHDCACDLV